VNGWRKKGPSQLLQSSHQFPKPVSHLVHLPTRSRTVQATPAMEQGDSGSFLMKPSAHSQTPSNSGCIPQSTQSRSPRPLHSEHSLSAHPRIQLSAEPEHEPQISRQGSHDPPKRNDLIGQVGRLKSNGKPRSNLRPSISGREIALLKSVKFRMKAWQPGQNVISESFF